MRRYRGNHDYTKQIVAVLLVIILIVLCVFTPVLKGIGKVAGSIITPVQSGITYVTDSVGGFFAYWKRVRSVDEQNKLLADENRKLKEENRNNARYKEEIEKLNELLELKGDYTNYETVSASVVGKEAGNWFNVFTLNKGSSHGITENSVVLVPEGVIGRVCEVGANWSKVVTLIDEEHSLSGMVERTGDLVQIDGDLKMMKSGLCKMSVITENPDIIIGDKIVTSGVGGIYPKGIYVGTLQSFKNNTEGTGSYAVIAPGVDFAHLSDVLVILGSEELE